MKLPPKIVDDIFGYIGKHPYIVFGIIFAICNILFLIFKHIIIPR